MRSWWSNGLRRYTQPRIAFDIDLVKSYSLNGKKSWAEWELAGLSVDEIAEVLFVNESATQDPGSKMRTWGPSPIESTLRGRLYCRGTPRFTSALVGAVVFRWSAAQFL